MIQDIRMIFPHAWMTFPVRIDDGVPGFIGDPEEAASGADILTGIEVP
jgi:hypothetical protein